ncbi:hypothetical protein PTTG_29833, partial [Puccinia triticina 1-1 BBBD Race 1]
GRSTGSQDNSNSDKSQHQDDGNNETNSDRNDDDESEEEEINLTLQNYQSQLSSWTIPALRQTLTKQKKSSNRIPTNIQEILNFQKANYIKTKLMLALIGRVSEKMVNSFLGEDKPTCAKSSYSRFLAFSVKSAEIPVPPKGISAGWNERNQKLGQAWKLLTEDERSVFNAKVFSFFSKLPIICDANENNDESENGSESEENIEARVQASLSEEEKALYEHLYENLVNHEKVQLASGQGLDTGRATPPQAMKSVICLNSELFTIANAYNLTFYLLAATRSPGSGSFCKELSNNPYWLLVAKKEWAAKETFEAYSHGQAIQQTVDECSSSKQPLAKKPKRADEIRCELCSELNKLLAQALGRDKAKFPMQKDPFTGISSKHPGLKIYQFEASHLTAQNLKVGLECMLTENREKWLTCGDVARGLGEIWVMVMIYADDVAPAEETMSPPQQRAAAEKTVTQVTTLLTLKMVISK